MTYGRKYPSIGVLIDYMNGFAGGYEEQLRKAFTELAERRKIQVFMMYGRGLDDPHPPARAHNTLFTMASPRRLDGAILLSSSLSAHCGVDRLLQLAEDLQPLPLCSVALELPGVPTVLVDGERAINELVDHMITQHQRSRFAFIGGVPGNPESRDRRAALKSCLQRHGLTLRPEWDLDGDFTAQGAAFATAKILATSELPDAIVAASDTMALSVVRTLQERGIDVPGRVSVTGFDDLGVSPRANPPLTTVAQPFHALAARAVDTILVQLHGGDAPSVIRLPAKPMFRRSCGCGFRPLAGPSSAPGPVSSAASHLERRRKQLTSYLEHSMACTRWDAEHQAGQVIDALTSDLTDKPGSLLSWIQATLQKHSADTEICRALQDAIACLRQEFRAVSSPELEDVWHEARDLIGRAEASWQAQHRITLDEMNWNLLVAAERTAGSLDLDALAIGLLASLPNLGVQTAYLSHFAEGPTGRLTSFLSMEDSRELDLVERSFDRELLIPPEATDVPGAYMVFPIVFETEVFGVAVYRFESNDPPVQLILRDQLAPALRAVRMHAEIVHRTREHERSLGEKVATAKRMESLSALAGGVAHDLNNTLGPIVALPELLEAQLEGKISDPKLMTQVAADLTMIKTAALRTAQTVRNLLALGRQGRTRKAPVDIGEIVNGCLRANPLAQVPGADARIRVLTELSAARLTVKGAENQLVRAVENLIRNAIEAIANEGTITIRTDRKRLTSAHSGYEVVAPGEYVLLTVSDTGSGISPEAMMQIFEPFFSTKKAAEQSGTGLGLAIVHGVIKEHEGYLDVTSSDAGTTFTCYIPFERVMLESAPPRSDVPVGKARVLVVDDEPSQRLTAERVLRHLGYDVDVVPNEEDAIRYFESVRSGLIPPYDVVILDVLLGGGADGLQLREQLQSIAPGFRTILASGHASQEHRAAAKARGLPWLPKPYTLDLLARRVQAELR